MGTGGLFYAYSPAKAKVISTLSGNSSNRDRSDVTLPLWVAKNKIEQITNSQGY